MGNEYCANANAWRRRIKKEEDEFIRFMITGQGNEPFLNAGTLGIPIIRGNLRDAPGCARRIREEMLKRQGAENEVADDDVASMMSYPSRAGVSEAGSAATTDSTMIRKLKALEKALEAERKQNKELEAKLRECAQK